MLDSNIRDLKKTNLAEESQVIKMKAEMACLESRVRLFVSLTGKYIYLILYTVSSNQQAKDFFHNSLVS